LEILENKAVRFRTREPHKYSVIPKHHVQPIPGGYEVSVYWGLDEMRVLKNLGVKSAPSPIERNYNWPGRYTPMAHQKTTAGFLTLHRRAFVFNDPGTAKTIAALWAADYLMKRGEVRRVLVVCPLSIMQSAWMGDINRSVIHRSAVIAHHAQASRRIELIQGDYEIVIINYDGLNLVADEINADGRFDLIIVDEANAYATATTRRWKSLAKIIKPQTFLWMMTGTPAAQSPLHAYGLAKLVNPTAIPSYFTAWRDKVMHKITMFKWAPKLDAKDQVFNVLQPAIRYTKAQCLDLPPVLKQTRQVSMTPQQAKYYKLIKDQMLAQVAGETITAVNKAAVVSKLLQISCIGYNTDVLTNTGWRPIQTVAPHDLLWDGVEWVRHQGLLHKGAQSVIECGGVMMTADHEVLTTIGWRTAKETVDGESSKKFSRADVRLPDSSATQWNFGRPDPESAVAVPVHMRETGRAREPVFARSASRTPPQLWLPSRERNAQDVVRTPVPYMDTHAAAVYGPLTQGLQELRGTWNKSLRTMADILRRFLGGHAKGVHTEVNAGAHAQQRKLYAQELPVGNGGTAVQQHTQQRVYRDAVGAHNSSASGAEARVEQRHPSATTRKGVALGTRANGACDTRKQEVFDIHNCGPRSRFVVRSAAGEMSIVHNCGAALTENKEVIEFDATPRLNVLLEILEETSRKVIIFAMFRASIAQISTFLHKHGVMSEEIHGGVTATQRGDIIQRFQNAKDPRVLVMQPQATAHGITLTAADTVIFFGPLMSVEQYVQAIARADRQGQTSDKVTVVHIEGSPIEQKMFAAMDTKVDDHALLSGMFEEEMKGG
jgi:superfamily II DNA or RNA helicase